MPRKRITLQVLSIGLVAVAAGAITVWMMLGKIEMSPRWAGRLSILVEVLAVWMAYGWWRGRQRYWGWLAIGFGASAWAARFWAIGWHGSAVAVTAAVVMGVCFVLLLEAAKWSLEPSFGVFGVARVLIQEAVRTRVAVTFCAMLFIWIAVLPQVLDQTDPLKYRVQTFLTYSLSGVSVALTVMTVLVACGTVCTDLERCHIQLALTKRIGRLHYLLGKWVGIMLLDLCMLLVAGAGVYTFTKSMQQLPGQDAYDRAVVDEQILVARVASRPSPPDDLDLNAQFEQRLEQLRNDDPGRYRGELDPGARREIQHAVLAKWHTIRPLGTGRFVFQRLGHAKEFGDAMQLRLKATSSRTPPEERVHMAIWLNGRLLGPIDVVDRVYQVINIPTSAVDEQGRLEVTIQNINLQNPQATFPSSISFTPNEGLEVLYQVGRFEPNLVRALAMVWVRLGFVGMLGLCAGTFLGFPVACLMCLLVYFSSAASGFLFESLAYYAALGGANDPWWKTLLSAPVAFYGKVSDGAIWEACKIVIRLVGGSFLALIPSLSEYNPVPQIADGRLVSGSVLWTMAWRVGLVWTGACGVVGWVTLRRRELARVIV